MASRIGRNTRVGSVAPCWARYMKIVTGNSVNDELLSTRNRICALVAVFFCGLSSCNECMALMPIGVAALSSPRMFAAKFMLICPRAGWPLGTPGISRRNSGSSSRASRRISPAFSAIASKPSHRVMVPTRTSTISTLSRAMSNRAATSRLKTSLSPMPSHCQSAAAKAARKKLSQIPLSMRWAVPGQGNGWLSWAKLSGTRAASMAAVWASGSPSYSAGRKRIWKAAITFFRLSSCSAWPEVL